jgi:hypothetical protein
MTYQAYPTGPGGNEMAGPPAQPRSIQNAVKLMYLGAGLSAVGLIVSLLSIGSLKSALEKANRTATKPLTATQLHSAEVVGIVTVVFLSVIGIALWLWMARANGAGKSWARIVAAVLFGLSTLSTISAVARPNAIGTTIFGLLGWLVGLGATIFLWRRDSSQFFAGQSAGTR